MSLFSSPSLRLVRHRGYTLIELSFVTVIMGILVALLLPAVQQAREAARRTECKNNLHQLGIAFHTYQDAFRTLPPGVVDLSGPIQHTPSGYHHSWVTSLLPYLDQPVLARHLDPHLSIYEESQLEVTQVVLPTMLCPSDGAPVRATQENQRVGLSNYAGNHHSSSASIDVTNHGVLFLNSRVRYNDIYDGVTSTVLAGEMIRDEHDLGWASGTRATLRNAGTPLNNATATTGYGGYGGYGGSGGYSGGGGSIQQPSPVVLVEASHDPGGFSSHHTGGAQFLLCDGSVRFLSENIDPLTFLQLFDRAEGVVTNDF